MRTRPRRRRSDGWSRVLDYPKGRILEPVFLSAEPVAVLERRKLIRERIDVLSEKEFRELYPALRRLLEER